MVEEDKGLAQGEVQQEDPLQEAGLDLTPEEEEALLKAESGEGEAEKGEAEGSGEKKEETAPGQGPKWEETPEYQGFKRAIFDEREKRRQLESQIEELNRKITESAGKRDSENVSDDNEDFLTKGEARKLLAQLRDQAEQKQTEAKKQEAVMDIEERILKSEKEASEKYKDMPAGLDYASAMKSWDAYLTGLPQAERVATMNLIASSSNPAEKAYSLALQTPELGQKFARHQALELIKANRNRGSTAMPKTSGAPQEKAVSGPMTSEEEMEALLAKSPEELEAEARATE
jgi:hypothetical protein